MKPSLKASLKHSLKKILGKCAYYFFYTQKKLNKYYNKCKKELLSLKNCTWRNILFELLPHWKIVSLYISIFIILFYGIGAIISSHINNNTEKKLALSSSSSTYIAVAMSHLIKSQIDETAWTPALPIIFPASILDNVPNFQLGVKDSVAYMVKNISAQCPNNALKEASQLLNYSPNIWLFSKNTDNKFSPSSAKQYRKALAKITEYGEQAKAIPCPITAVFLLDKLNILLERRLNKINKQITEHSTDFLDTKSDDIFYDTQGTIYTAYYLLEAIAKEYQNDIVATEQYENITSALKTLKEALELSPLIVKNAPLNDVYKANHLAYLRYYISETQNKILKISDALKKIKNNDN